MHQIGALFPNLVHDAPHWCMMVRCNNGAVQQWCGATWLIGAVQHNHNGIMVFVRCNITTMASWSLCGATMVRCNMADTLSAFKLSGCESLSGDVA
jgi:hypothetical protein